MNTYLRISLLCLSAVCVGLMFLTVRTQPRSESLMCLTGDKTRLVFDRFDIVTEGDLVDGARTLNQLTGAISGTIAKKPIPGRMSWEVVPEEGIEPFRRG